MRGIKLKIVYIIETFSQSENYLLTLKTMSSTNRSDARDSHIADYYITPQKPIEAFLTEFCKDE